MKPILYLAVIAMLFARTRQLLNEYNLLPLDIINIPYEDDLEHLNFMKSYQSIPVKDLSITNTTLTSPFILETKFKLYEEKSSFMFSLEDKKKTPQFALKFSPGEENVMRISLLRKTNDPEIMFPLTNITGDFNTIILFVEDDKVTLYLNCVELDSREVEKTTISFDNDSHFVVGKSEVYKVESTFPGAIDRIKIYPKATGDTMKTFCNDDSSLRDLTDYTEETFYEDEIPPENLTLEKRRGDMVDVPEYDEHKDMEKGDKGEVGNPGVQGEKGFKGEKGEKGVVGIKGEPGESIKGQLGPTGQTGMAGPIGPPGKRGEEGKCECSETMVSTLIRLMPEMKGPRGEQGPKGEDGNPGVAGLTGKTGPQGDRGPEGLQGKTGRKGDDGKTGLDGIRGLKGDPGKDGHAGPPGPQGLQGPPGPPGLMYMETEEEKKKRQVFIPGVKGDIGPEGPPGRTGPQGYKGDMGDRGEEGPIGNKGDQGDKGPEGPRGEKGDRGEAGKDGLPGSPGNHGRPGAKGDKGDTGDKGAPGLAGLSARLTDLLDPNMDPFDNEQIVKKLRGEKGNAGVNGEKGIKGERGLTGETGTSGKDGRDGDTGLQGNKGLKGDIGPTGPRGHKGLQGEAGPPGQVPASEIALMKGSKGDRGAIGARGYRGPNGSRGPKGAKGTTGPIGKKGDLGPRGPVGPMGPSGFNGTHGMKGDKGECAILNDFETKVKGEKGDSGVAGIPGKPGESGPPGPPGQNNTNSGPPGPIGPPGPPGPPGLSITGPKGEPGSYQSTSSTFSGGFTDETDDSYTVNTIIFRSKTALISRTSTTPLGTIAYIMQEDIMLVRVRSGWRYVEMGSIFPSEELKQYPSQTTRQQRHQYLLLPSTTTTSTSRPIDRINYIRIAALNNPQTGKVYSKIRTGHIAADYECNQQSLAAGYNGNFRAFLTNRVQDAISMVNHRERHLPVKNLRGDLLFPSWNSIFNGSEASFVHNVNIYSFDGRNVMTNPHWPNKVVWHGSDASGVRLKESFCDEWDDESNFKVGMASSLKNKKLLGQDMFPCDNKLIVLCVEVSSSEPRPRRHYSSRTNRRHPYSNEIRSTRT